jgi:hypothetical protein
MKVEAPTDIDGRLIAVSNRLSMMHEALGALASAYGIRQANEADEAQGSKRSE